MARENRKERRYIVVIRGIHPSWSRVWRAFQAKPEADAFRTILEICTGLELAVKEL